MARAIAIKPDLLLLDEPLSAVDVETKHTYERELSELHKRLKLPTIHVTHDFEETIALGDRMAVMSEGQILQIGTPQQIFRHPTSEFVARFFMTLNIFQGEVRDAPGGQSVFCFEGQNLAVGTALRGPRYASIRPEDVEIFAQSPESKENLFKGTIAHKAYLGNFLYFFVSVNDTMIRVQVPHYVPHEEGEELYLFLNPKKCIVLI